MTQCKRIIQWCNKHGSITTYDAFIELGITQLATRIRELEIYDRYEFVRERVKSTNRYGEPVSFTKYILVIEEEDTTGW